MIDIDIQQGKEIHPIQLTASPTLVIRLILLLVTLHEYITIVYIFVGASVHVQTYVSYARNNQERSIKTLWRTV